MMDLGNKTALITGASSGIGRATAHALASEGARLILTGRSRERLDEVAHEVSPAEAVVIPADLCERASLEKLAAEARDRFKAIDILVNCAGVGMYVPSFDADPVMLRRLFELNFFAPVDLTARLLPAMPRGGAVVNISSIGGKVPLPWLSLYSASKYALNGYSDGLRMELNGRGIQVMCVCPGFVETPFRDNVLVGRIPPAVNRQRRFKITAEQCAAAIVDGLKKGKRTVVTPRIGWALVALVRLFPGVIFPRMARMRTPQPEPGDGRG
jgi:short-subunit dehydrogenase